MITGIDLGTTFSVISKIGKDGTATVISNSDGERTTPSVVMFEEDNVIVGSEAKENSILDPLNVVQFVKRQMGDKNYEFYLNQSQKYTAEEISAMILKKLKNDAEKQTGEKIEGVVITVPAYFDDAQRKSTQDAGTIAGLNVLGIINEPTAAALAYCHSDGTTSGNMMVFDIGGGTLDITIMEVTDDFKNVRVLSTYGDRNLGGFDFDNLIIKKAADYFQNEFDIDIEDDENCYQDLRLKAENAKKSLSTRAKVSFVVDCDGHKAKIELTRDEFDEMMSEYLETMSFLVDCAIGESNLTINQIDKVLLVGGSSKMPCIQNMLREKMGIEPSTEMNPDEVVSIGAAYYAQKIVGDNNVDVKLIDVNSHDLGVVANNINGIAVMNTIIAKNTPLETKCVKEFCTSVEYQQSIRVEVVESDGEEDLEYCKKLGESEIKINHLSENRKPIQIEMFCDSNGVLHVTAIDKEYNEFLGEFSVNRESNLSDEEIDEKKKNMDNMEI